MNLVLGAGPYKMKTELKSKKIILKQLSTVLSLLHEIQSTSPNCLLLNCFCCRTPYPKSQEGDLVYRSVHDALYEDFQAAKRPTVMLGRI